MSVDIESENVQIYVKYVGIRLVPSSVSLVNAYHMKMDCGYAFYLDETLQFWIAIMLEIVSHLRNFFLRIVVEVRCFELRACRSRSPELIENCLPLT